MVGALSRSRRLRERAKKMWFRVWSPRPPVCDDLKEWASLRSASNYRVLAPALQITRRLPQTVELQVDTQYLEMQAAMLREKFLLEISPARIVGENGIVVLPGGEYVSDSIYNRALLEKEPDYYARRSRPIVRKPGNYFSLLVIWSKGGNYYHWMHDSLLRLFGVQEWLPEDTRYIVPARLTPVQLETLRLLGIREDRLARFGGEEIWEVERLYYTNCATNSGSDRREADEWLRDRILSGHELESTASGRRLIVSRRDAPARGLANEPAVEEYLRRFGFETCVLGTLTHREQVEVFAQAEIVVAPHGAGLTNMLFAPPGLVVVDMIPPSKMAWGYVFWAMAEELSHRYWYFVADESPEGTDTYVSIEKLAATLDRIGLVPRGSGPGGTRA